MSLSVDYVRVGKCNVVACHRRSSYRTKWRLLIIRRVVEIPNRTSEVVLTIVDIAHFKYRDSEDCISRPLQIARRAAVSSACLSVAGNQLGCTGNCIPQYRDAAVFRG